MRNKIVLACFITILACMVAAPAHSTEELFDTATATKHLEKGISLLQAKKYDAAIGEFEESAEVNPDAEAYYYLGYTYYLKGRKGDEASRKKSRENFDKAYAINPNFSPSRFKPAEPAPAKETMQKQEPAEAPTPAAQTAEPATPQPPQPMPPVEQPKQ
jgi:tetratricopeptide (TPR) repeat protein